MATPDIPIDDPEAIDALADVPPEPETAPAPELAIGSVSEAAPVRLPAKLRGHTMADGTVVATGRRKTAVARVRIKRGTGTFVVNERPADEFFPVDRDRLAIRAPLKATSLDGQIDVWVRVAGGGVSGQAGAIVLGIARCLQTLQPDLHGTLSDGGYLTRDDRMVERKKYGHRKARRSFQFSKR